MKPAASPAPLIEGQLNITLQLILGFSASITLEELQSIRRCVARMDHTVNRALAAKTFESDGVAPIGNGPPFPIRYVR